MRSKSAANANGSVRAGNGVASGRIGRQTPIYVVDTILTGVHQPGESHFELLEAFANDAVLAEISDAFSKHRYRSHEFGDSLLIERRPRIPRRWPNTEATSRNACFPAAIGAKRKCLQRAHDAIERQQPFRGAAAMSAQ